MSKQEKTEFEINTQTLRNGLIRAIIIEYKVTKEEINRYDVILKESDKIT